jgi:hypothetical protein
MIDKQINFKGVILRNKEIDASYVEFPYDVFETYGVKGQVKVKVLFDDKITYRGSLAKMGFKCHVIGITKEIRKQLNKTFGDIVDIKIERDIEVREVNIPNDALELLNNNPRAKSYFDTLSFTNRKEYIVWIESAKKEETRQNRLVAFIDKLNQGKKLVDK